MAIYAYRNISRKEITAPRVTSEGKTYSLNHPNELVIDMRYKGENKSTVNSQGWERSSSYYFKELYNKHPEYFSKKNAIRIENGESPRVDARFVKAFPQYAGYENETLIHHHIGKDGQAVAVPQSIHKGSGEIHTIEDELGITDNAREFSDYCREKCGQNETCLGKSADYFKAEKNKEKGSADQAMSHDSENAFTRTRNISPEVSQSREQDTETVLDNYRENLHDHGVTDEGAIDSFLSQERSKIDAEYESLDRGDEYPQMYETPTDWEGISASMKEAGQKDGYFSEPEDSDQQSTESALSERYSQSYSGRNAFSSATIENVGEEYGYEHSSGNAFSNATLESYSSGERVEMSDGMGYSPSSSSGNAFSEASSPSLSGGSSGGSSESASPSQSESQGHSR